MDDDQNRLFATKYVDGVWTCPDCGKRIKCNVERLRFCQIRQHAKTKVHQQKKVEKELAELKHLKVALSSIMRSSGVSI